MMRTKGATLALEAAVRAVSFTGPEAAADRGHGGNWDTDIGDTDFGRGPAVGFGIYGGPDLMTTTIATAFTGTRRTVCD